MAQTPELTVLGGGLAGCEAAWQAAERGVQVALYEMRPQRPTAAHKTDQLAELVCSNSLGSSEITNAAGILKEEMRRLGSLVVRVADTCTVPAGTALAVDRVEFAARITKEISTHPNITVIREEVTTIPAQGPVIIATGPLTSDALAESLKMLTRAERLYFFDAISPIVDGETIDRSIAFGASRYNKGGADYLNCPMSRAEYDAFYDELLSAQAVEEKDWERANYFEGCLPLEELARRGRDTLRFGPMKPVGLVDPRTGARPHAVVQLRPEDVHGQAYNMVGFQTKLKWPEQKRVFRMIPGLERAEFLRLGSLHRNTFINAPLLVRETLQFRQESRIFFAGQIVGVEGYTESAGMGLLAGMNAARLIQHQPLLIPPPTTTLGTLITYLTKSDPRTFQPMNVNLGLFPPLPTRIVQREVRRQKIVDRALNDLDRWKTQSVSS